MAKEILYLKVGVLIRKNNLLEGVLNVLLCLLLTSGSSSLKDSIIIESLGR